MAGGARHGGLSCGGVRAARRGGEARGPLGSARGGRWPRRGRRRARGVARGAGPGGGPLGAGASGDGLRWAEGESGSLGPRAGRGSARGRPAAGRRPGAALLGGSPRLPGRARRRRRVPAARPRLRLCLWAPRGARRCPRPCEVGGGGGRPSCAPSFVVVTRRAVSGRSGAALRRPRPRGAAAAESSAVRGRAALRRYPPSAIARLS